MFGNGPVDADGTAPSATVGGTDHCRITLDFRRGPAGSDGCASSRAANQARRQRPANPIGHVDVDRPATALGEGGPAMAALPHEAIASGGLWAQRAMPSCSAAARWSSMATPAGPGQELGRGCRSRPSPTAHADRRRPESADDVSEGCVGETVARSAGKRPRQSSSVNPLRAAEPPPGRAAPESNDRVRGRRRPASSARPGTGAARDAGRQSRLRAAPRERRDLDHSSAHRGSVAGNHRAGPRPARSDGAAEAAGRARSCPVMARPAR